MGHTYKRRHDLRARINARVKRLERERSKEGTPVPYAADRPERLNDALQLARAEVMRQGGKITVALGHGIELPEHWHHEPRLHVMNTVGLTYNQLPAAMPSNTRIVILSGNIPGAIYNPIHREIKRRHINYLIRRGLPEVEHELEQWLKPVVVDELPPPPLPSEPEPPPPPPPSTLVDDVTPDATTICVDEPTTLDTEKDDMAIKTGERGSVTEFVLAHAHLDDARSSIADEARRLFKIAQQIGVKTTVASLAQSISVQKRKARTHARPTRPAKKPAAPVARQDSSLLKTLDVAIGALADLRDDLIKIDKTHAALAKERDSLKARLDLLATAFKKLAD